MFIYGVLLVDVYLEELVVASTPVVLVSFSVSVS